MQEDETDYFNEVAYIYKTGYDDDYEEVENGPSVYAHYLLSLFGAVELKASLSDSSVKSSLSPSVYAVIPVIFCVISDVLIFPFASKTVNIISSAYFSFRL